MSLLNDLNPEVTLQWITIIASIGVIILTCEYLVALRRLSDYEILSWEVSKFQGKWSLSGVTGKAADYFLAYPRFKYVLIVRLIAAILVGTGAVLGLTVPVLLFVVLITTLSINLRSAFGLDGAYQMTLIVFGALFLGSLAPPGSLAREACLWFLALQGGLAYVVAGVSKLISSTWRDGTALAGIFSTSIYGHPVVYKLLARRPQLSKILSWTTIAFECSFPIVLLVDTRYSFILLAGGIMFHALTAVFMGLNGFFFAFIAPYPAIVLVNMSIQKLTGGLVH